MKEITIVLYLLIFIIWLSGAIASFCELHAQRWHHLKIQERLALAMLWPLNLILTIWISIKWIKGLIKGE